MNFVIFLNSRPADDRQALRAMQERCTSLISRRLVGHESYRVQQDGIRRIGLINHLVVLRNSLSFQLTLVVILVHHKKTGLAQRLGTIRKLDPIYRFECRAFAFLRSGTATPSLLRKRISNAELPSGRAKSNGARDG